MIEPKWYSEITPYQWRVLICACLGWALDIMDGYLYAIILFPAMSDLLGTSESAQIGLYGGVVLSIFMIGWALGGLIFGPIADRYGRAKTMAITILIYASFTGLCGIAGSWQELAVYRFLTGIGIGGEWAAGAALIAESWPAKARAKAAGIMQASGGIGFFLAIATVSLYRPLRLALGLRTRRAAGDRRFLHSLLPRRTASAGCKAKSTGKTPSPHFSTETGAARRPDRHWARSGRDVRLSRRHSMGAELDRRHAARARHKGSDPSSEPVTTMLTTGGIIGCLCLPFIADRWGRKHALLIYFLGALLSVPTTFLLARELSHAVIAAPIMGFFAAGVTTGFAIYFPELFPTAIRATAQGFCFNFARFFSAAGPLARRRAHFGAWLLRTGNRDHRLYLFLWLDHSNLCPRNQRPGAAGLGRWKRLE